MQLYQQRGAFAGITYFVWGTGQTADTLGRFAKLFCLTLSSADKALKLPLAGL